MSAVPDRVLADLREHEQHIEHGNAVWDACAPQAIQELKEQLLSFPLPTDPLSRQPSIDHTLDVLHDDFFHALGDGFQEYRNALATEDAAEIGRLVIKARDAAIADYVASDVGQRWIANRVTQMQHEQEDA
jgi:hypothetical protein